MNLWNWKILRLTVLCLAALPVCRTAPAYDPGRVEYVLKIENDTVFFRVPSERFVAVGDRVALLEANRLRAEHRRHHYIRDRKFAVVGVMQIVAIENGIVRALVVSGKPAPDMFVGY